MADGAAGRSPAAAAMKAGGSGRPKLPVGRLEETMLNRYAALQAFLALGVKGSGYLALTWSTVVLLGGYVTSLGRTEFWCLTVISMIQAAGIFNDFIGEEIFSGYLDVVTSFVMEWNDFTGHGFIIIRMLKGNALLILAAELIVVPFATVLIFVTNVYLFGPFACVALSSWRLGQRNYGSTDGGDGRANMMPAALDMFYSLVIFQGTMFGVWHLIDCVRVKTMILRFQLAYPLSDKWGIQSIRKYFEDTRAKCYQDPASIKGRNLISYAVGLLDSESLEEYLSGARLLSAILNKGEEEEEQVRLLLLCSRPKIQKLTDTLRWRSSSLAGDIDSREIRELAATIMAHLAGDIDLAQYPGAVHCISSLLQEETTKIYWNSNQVTRRLQSPRLLPRWQLKSDKEKIMEKEKEERRWQKWMEKEKGRWQKRMREQDPSSGNGRHDCSGIDNFSSPFKRMTKAERVAQERKKGQDPDHVQQKEMLDHRSSSNGTDNKLILQSFTILERLASGQQNCIDICSAPGLIPKIKVPICSSTLIRDISCSSAWADVVHGSLRVLHRLMSVPAGEITISLRREISSNDQARSNLLKLMILGLDKNLLDMTTLSEKDKNLLELMMFGDDKGGGAGQEPLQMLISMEQRRELQMRAMEILTELYRHLPSQIKPNIIKKQLWIFVFLSAGGGEQEPASMLNLKATAGRNLVYLSTDSNTDILACITGSPAAKSIVVRVIELLEAKNNIMYRIIAAKLLESLLLEKGTKILDNLWFEGDKRISENLCTHGNLEQSTVKEILMLKVLAEMPYSTRESPGNQTAGKEQGMTLVRRLSNVITETTDEIQGTFGSRDLESQLTMDNDSPGDERRSSDTTKELQEALLSLMLVILQICACDFDDMVEKNAQELEVYVDKLKPIIDDVNDCHAKTSVSLRIVKLCGQIAVLMMRHVHKYTQHLKDQEFDKSLFEASKLMSGLESCMLFTGTDVGMKKIGEPLASLATEVQQLVG